ncbi:MAG: diguanylate cyclase [bacterium]
MTDTDTILVVDDTRENLKLLVNILTEAGYRVRPADSGELALAAIDAERPALILLDVRMPGMDGFAVCRQLKSREETRDIPVIFISAFTEVEERVVGFQVGGVDFVTKPFQQDELLARVKTHLELSELRRRLTQHAMDLQLANDQLLQEIEGRKRVEAEIREIAVRDELTGLYNRRGFFVLTEQQFKIVQRTRKPLLLIFLDVDGLKGINDQLGHQEGDCALQATARLLQQTFRESDIIARLGGDEFALLLINNTLSAEAFSARLHQALETYNLRAEQHFALAMSWGMARYDPAAPVSLDQLLATADQEMYGRKSAKYARSDCAYDPQLADNKASEETS